jgi:hypothetical protein
MIQQALLLFALAMAARYRIARSSVQFPLGDFSDEATIAEVTQETAAEVTSLRQATIEPE